MHYFINCFQSLLLTLNYSCFNRIPLNRIFLLIEDIMRFLIMKIPDLGTNPALYHRENNIQWVHWLWRKLLSAKEKVGIYAMEIASSILRYEHLITHYHLVHLFDPICKACNILTKFWKLLCEIWGIRT